MSNKSQLQTNNTNLDSLITRVNAAKDTASSLPDAGSGTQATPVISVSSNGLITATAGTKSSTYQLAFQPAKTITPTTTSQVAVSSGYYTGGSITVKGDANLVAGNIKSGVSIFGVSGTYAGGSGDTSMEDGIIMGTVASYTNTRVTSIRAYTFYYCSTLTEVNFPEVQTIGSYAFQSCSNLLRISFPKATTIRNAVFYSCYKLVTANFPEVKTIGTSAFARCSSLTTASFPQSSDIGSSAFYSCSKLTSVNFPEVQTIGNYAFQLCSGLSNVNFPRATRISNYGFLSCNKLTTASFSALNGIGNGAFQSCVNLKSLYLTQTNNGVCTLDASNAFSSTPIGGYSTSAGTYGSIYVPASLLASYKAATNWTYFSSRFVGI